MLDTAKNIITGGNPVRRNDLCRLVALVALAIITAVPAEAEPARLFALSSDLPYHSPYDILELDPETGSVLAQFAAPELGYLIAFDGQTLFVLGRKQNGPYRLWHLDPDSGEILVTIDIQEPISFPFGFAAVQSGLFATLGSADPIAPGSDRVVQIDPMTGEILLSSRYTAPSPLAVFASNPRLGSQWSSSNLIGSSTEPLLAFCPNYPLEAFELEPATGAFSPFAFNLMAAAGRFAESLVTEVDDELFVSTLCDDETDLVAINSLTGLVRELPVAGFYVDLASGPGSGAGRPVAVPALQPIGWLALAFLLSISGLRFLRQRRRRGTTDD